MDLRLNNIPSLDVATMEWFGLKKLGTFYSKKSKNTLDHLQSNVMNQKMTVLCGKHEMGKTTLIRQLKNRLFMNTTIAHVKALDDSKILMGSILDALIRDVGSAGIYPRRTIEARSRQAIRILGQSHVTDGKPVVLLIDNTPERLHLNTLNALKLLMEEDFAGHAPLLSIVIICWPDFLDKIGDRDDLTHRMDIIKLDERHGWFTFADRVKYLEDVFAHVITDKARRLLAKMYKSPGDLDWHVSQLMKKIKMAYKGDLPQEDRKITLEMINPSISHLYETLKKNHANQISYSMIAKRAGVSKSTVAGAINDEPDIPSTRKVHDALLGLMDEFSGGGGPKKDSDNDSNSQSNAA